MPNPSELARIEEEAEPTLKRGQLVEYVGDMVGSLLGKRGTVVTARNRKGYTVVDFNGVRGNFLPFNLKPVEAEQLTEAPQAPPILPSTAVLTARTLRLKLAAQAMLDAFGGDTPDWLRAEAQLLQEAIDAF